uniref:ribosomal protein S3 n=1 Tax=Hydnora esculenta TaxID=1851369 RepID=UPI00211426CD|nr:ribosomal protein S3 [Hydnora esculenta]USN93645.1 ribosomal protein S3 [Hydnora esculenta]
MGQKANSAGIRLGIHENYNSFWFNSKNRYPLNIKEDEKLRNCIINFFKKNYNSTNIIESIKIKKKINLINIKIRIFTNLRVKKVKGFNIKLKLYETIYNFIKPKNIKFYITLVRLKNPYANSNFITRYIELQLKNKISFNKIINTIFELIKKKTTIKGIQIQLKGRIFRRERAYITWDREGLIPIQTLRTNINYYSKSIKTRCGMIGIKVWILA